jgi:hypothetical protein
VKKLLILLMLFCCFAAVACVADDPAIDDDEAEVLVSTPDAGAAEEFAARLEEHNRVVEKFADKTAELLQALDVPPVEDIIVPGCDAPESDPGRVCDGGGGGGGGGGSGGGTGGGGSGGGTCEPGDPGCSGPPNPNHCPWGFRWNNTRRQCESESAGEPCGRPAPGEVCRRDIMGTCHCQVPLPPLLTGGSANKVAADNHANIIVPGCDAPESDPGRVCEGTGGGGGGGGSGGGGGGGTGGGGTCTPGAPGCSGPILCTPPWREGTVNGTRRCVPPNYGEPCTPPLSQQPPPYATCRIDENNRCSCYGTPAP